MVGIHQQGHWLPQQFSIDELQRLEELPIRAPAANAVERSPFQIITAETINQDPTGKANNSATVVFPVIHGTNGEDGKLQGLLEIANVAYVGSNHLGSSMAMDKSIAKTLVKAAGIKVADWIELRQPYWQDSLHRQRSFMERHPAPWFVKPSNLGSSVGISKVTDAKNIERAAEKAFQFDNKALVERGILGREIEVAVLGNGKLRVSVPGELEVHEEFYSYDAKYVSESGASIVIPAKLSQEQGQQVRKLAADIFNILCLEDMARIDFFLEEKTGQFVFNEANTIPGFTSISQFPLLWKESGLEAEELIENLVQSAIGKKQKKDRLQTSYQQNGN